jgi:hypothetical protein
MASAKVRVMVRVRGRVRVRAWVIGGEGDEGVRVAWDDWTGQRKNRNKRKGRC